MHSIASSLLCAVLAAAPQREQLTPAPAPAFDLASPRSEVLTQVAEDGTLWVRGSNYKLHFTPEQVEYIPAFGARAPRSLPLVFDSLDARAGATSIQFDARAEPVLGEGRVVYDRGAFLETWDFALDHVEQSFVLFEDPRGELVLHLGLATELAGCRGEAGLVFEAPGLGEVRIGDVETFDARGACVRTPTQLGAGGLELRVPAAFLAQAQYPVVVDPHIATFFVDGGAESSFDPDVAYGSVSDVWLVVYEDVIAANDRDILSRRYSPNGMFLDEVAVDITDEQTADPALAYHMAVDQFFTVWMTLGDGSSDARIRGRMRHAGGTTQSVALDISDGVGANHPDVGGPVPFATESFFVVWSEVGEVSGRDVRGCLVHPNLVVYPPVEIDARPGDQLDPAISQVSGASRVWAVAYEHVVSPTERDILYRTVRENGTPNSPPQPTDFDSDVIRSNPDVSGDGANFLIVFERQVSGGNRDIEGYIEEFNLHFPRVRTYLLLTAREPGSVAERDQLDPAVTITPNGFTYAYRERQPAGQYSVFAASIAAGTHGAEYLEGHVALGLTPLSDTDVALGSMYTGGQFSYLALAVWTRQQPSSLDVMAAFYQIP